MADTQAHTAPLADQAKQQAQQVVQQGRQAASQLWDAARGQFHTTLTGQKERAASNLDEFAELIRETGQQLASQGHAGGSGYAQQIATRVSDFASSVHDKEVEELLADTENFARRQPAAFLAVAALLGFALTRFLRSSGQAAAAA